MGGFSSQIQGGVRRHPPAACPGHGWRTRADWASSLPAMPRPWLPPACSSCLGPTRPGPAAPPLNLEGWGNAVARRAGREKDGVTKAQVCSLPCPSPPRRLGRLGTWVALGRPLDGAQWLA